MKGAEFMSDKVTSKQFLPGIRTGFFFIFRLRPNFFVGFIPRTWGAFGADPGYGYDNNMSIERIDEQEYLFLQRLGVPEVQVTI